MALTTAGYTGPGAYVLTNIQAGTVLDLDHGAWKDGTKIQGWTHSTGSDDAQDWLISEVNDGVVNVVNLRSGSLMCAEGQLENGTAVSGYNVVATAPVAGWKISNENDTGGISTKLAVAGSDSFVLDLDNGSSSNGTAAQLETWTGSPNSRWSLDHYTADIGSTCSWMSQVSDGAPLTSLSIPGTHETCSLNTWLGSDNPHCQNQPPYMQLRDGIRSFDLRFDVKDAAGTALFSTHGLATEGYAFAAVLQSMKVFLEDNPTETIIVTFRYENDTDTRPYSSPKLFASTFQKEIQSFTGMLASNSTTMRSGIGSVRGRAVFLADPTLNLGNLTSDPIVFWGPGFVDEDHYQLTVYDQKWTYLTQNWNQAMADNTSNVAYASVVAMSNFDPLPGKEIDPIMFANWVQPKMRTFLAPVGQTRLGVVAMDFYAEDIVKTIIQTNKGVKL